MYQQGPILLVRPYARDARQCFRKTFVGDTPCLAVVPTDSQPSLVRQCGIGPDASRSSLTYLYGLLLPACCCPVKAVQAPKSGTGAASRLGLAVHPLTDGERRASDLPEAPMVESASGARQRRASIPATASLA